MPNVKNNASSQETRRKLIEAAGIVFANRGLHAATLKEITDSAGVNAAAINYHFSDKQELYGAVIRHAVSQAPCTLPEQSLAGSPEEKLRAYCAHWIGQFQDGTSLAWRASLLGRELNQPTAALDAVMDELVFPRVQFIQGLIREILGPRASPRSVSCGAFSLCAQILHYIHNAGLIARIQPELVRRENVDRMAAHIVEFSLAGLRAMRNRRRWANGFRLADFNL